MRRIAVAFLVIACMGAAGCTSTPPQVEANNYESLLKGSIGILTKYEAVEAHARAEAARSVGITSVAN